MGVHIRSVDGLRLEVQAPNSSFEVVPAREGTTVRPSELLLAALGSCVVGNALIAAQDMGVTLDDVHMDLSYVTTIGPPARMSRIRSNLELVGELTDEQRAKIIEIASTCAIHNTLHHGLQIDMDVAPARA